jgi:pimeloyl-ACP methyl ester carboxylesterase
MSSDTEIRPFQIDMSEEAIADLRRRIDAMRWPGQELVADRSQGVQLATLQALARYWATDYDWRRCEKRLNALPQFTTEIDGTRIHFIHVRSRHENALPLIMTHGWPGSVVELLESVGPLTDPTAHGGSAGDAFDLVLPSLAGYGFSAAPTEVGWNPGRMAQAWAELMRRLGYTRYVAQGGDVGASVTDAMGRQAPEGLAGIHMNLLVTALAGASADGIRAGTRGRSSSSPRSGRAASATSWSRPPGRRRSATRCWIHPSPWRPGCSTTTPTPTTRSPAPSSTGSRPGASPGTTVLDNITVYWLTGTGASAARSYWESARAQALAAGQAPPQVTIPVGFTTFPDEIFRAPRSWVEKGYPTLTYFNEAAKGGHFAAWEQPELFATEIRAAFRSLRT